MNKLIAAVLLLLIVCATGITSSHDRSVTRKLGRRIDYVPNEKVASQIADVILTSIYGEDVIGKQKPFTVMLSNDSVWVVRGTQKKIEIGGVAYIEISKRDCRILKVIHGK